MYRLYLFSRENGEDEFVIISDLPEQEIIDEYTHSRVTFDEAVDLGASASGFPCDRALYERPL